MKRTGNKLKSSIGSQLFDVINCLLLFCVGVIVIYPFLHVMAISMSDYELIMKGDVSIIPKGIHFKAYEAVFQNGSIMRAYGNTIEYTVVGTLISLLVTVMAAYSLANPVFKGKRFMAVFFTITMFFNGGLIPTYFLIRSLKMVDTIWAIVLPSAVSFYYIIIVRTNIQSIPNGLMEAAHLDGASHYRILFTIVIPLSLPILSTMMLFYMVEFWNDFFRPLIYLYDQKKQPLQVVLREILIKSSFGEMEDIKAEDIVLRVGNPLGYSKALKMACIMVATIPMLAMYPFIQKYFVKGALIGSIKG